MNSAKMAVAAVVIAGASFALGMAVSSPRSSSRGDGTGETASPSRGAGAGSRKLTQAELDGEAAEAAGHRESAFRAEVDKLRAENVALRSDLAETRRASEKLAAHVAALASEAQAARDSSGGSASSSAKKTDGKKKKLAVSFGRLGEIDALAKANWQECGEALKAMSPLLKDYIAKVVSGEKPNMDQAMKIQEQNMKLVKLAVSLADQLPTEGGINGAYTHPIVLANLMASHLDAVSLSLSDDQVRQIDALGEDFNTTWLAARAAWTDATLKLEKIEAELELKHAFVEKMLALLSPDQRAVVVDPATHDRFQLDLYSPVLMLAQLARPIQKPNADELKSAILAIWVEEWELDEAGKAALDAVAQTWVADNALQPLAPKDAGLFSLDDALVAIKASIKAAKEALRVLPPSDDRAKSIRETGLCPIPRLVVTPPK